MLEEKREPRNIPVQQEKANREPRNIPTEGNQASGYLSGTLQTILDEPAESGSYLLSHINRGLVGNFADLPFVLGNVLIEGINRVSGLDITHSALPSQNFLGLDTGLIFDPQRQVSDPDTAKSLRPLGIGLEFTAGAVAPQAALQSVAGRMTSPSIKQVSFGVEPSSKLTKVLPTKGSQGVAPTSVANKNLGGGWQTAGGSVVQSMTTRGSHIATVLSGSLSGVGAGVASDLSDGNPVAELVGGIAVPVAGILGAQGVGKAMGLKNQASFMKKESQQIETAMEVIARYSENPTAAYKALKIAVTEGRTGSLGSLTGDEGIAGLTKYLQKRTRGSEGGDSTFSSELLSLDKKGTQELADTLANMTDEAAESYFNNFMKGREIAFQETANTVINNAQKKASVVRGRMQEGIVDESQASKEIADLLDAADVTKDKMISTLWEGAPKGYVNKKKSVPIIKGWKDRTSIATQGDRDAVGGVFDSEIGSLLTVANAGRISVAEIISFRSNVNAKLRQMKVSQKTGDPAGLPKKIAYGEELQSRAMDLIVKSRGGANYKTIDNETRLINEAFSPLKKMRSDPYTVGKHLVQPGGERGLKRVDDVAKVSGYENGITDAVVEAFRLNYVKSAVKDGVVNPDNASKFLTKHSEVLQRPEFQKLRSQIEESSLTQQFADETVSRVKVLNSERQKAAFNLYTKHDFPSDAVDSVIRSKTALKDAESLVRQARVDRTGDAMLGLQRNFADAVLRKGFKRDGDFIDGVGALKPEEYARMRKVNEIIFRDNPESLKTMDMVFDAIHKTRKAKTAKQTDAKLAGSAMEEIVARMTGITVGGSKGLATFTGNPLIMSSLMSKFFKKLSIENPIDKTYRAMEDIILHPNQYEAAFKRVLDSETESIAVIRLEKLANKLYGVAPHIQEKEQEEKLLDF